MTGLRPRWAPTQATVWAGHSGDRVIQRSIEISEAETVIGCETDTDLVGFEIYRNSDGQCIDRYEAYTS